ncbi:unnamed protein product [Triticum turgidum subsp. durum]|uniref:Late embryogenesis abundant protein LEA-2 subgroup domain-containing protein n=1 Tax=Triticum turgidum subsp. durum TaxID=4567 RepID=A0A9R0UWX8_TRITD|nr:unnamed protein product [Triticum turgidum subsp. durum]
MDDKAPKPKTKAAVAAAAAPAPARTTPALKKPPLAPPPQMIPLKPPPAHHYRQQRGGGAPRKRHRSGSGCSGRRVCCLATGFLLLALCLAVAAACLAYLCYHPRPPSFHLQPVSTTRFRVGNSSAVSAVDVTAAVKVVSWNPNDKIAFEYGDGEGRVYLADSDGDITLGWAPVGGFEHGARRVAVVGFVAAAKGVVVDEAVAARVRTGMVPVRLSCDDGVMAPRGVSAGSPMSRCQVYLLRMTWFGLN